jgi:hypothetical protein
MGNCEKSQVVFDTTTLEKIVEDPQWILDNEQTFWAEYRAQILVRKWANQVKYDIPYDKWRERIQEWANLSQVEREHHELMKVVRRILAVKDEFLEKAILHDCSFLPDGVDLSVTIQFTAFVPPNAFAMEDIVIDVASKYWKANPEHILNLLVHEIFHVGYSFYRTLHTEKDFVEEALYDMLDNIASEGICTYVGYRALPIFRVEDEPDYRMLEDINEVHRLFANTNAVLSQYSKLPAEELQKLSWNKGVIERAYYVTGAHMCKTIDERKGRDALIDVYSKGPLSIIEFYNSIADEDLKIVLPEWKKPDKFSE